jgi:TP901 family phage tail tape measure protein
LLRVTEKLKNKNNEKTITEKTGNQFHTVTQKTTGKGTPLETTDDKDFKSLNKYVATTMDKLKTHTHLASEEVDALEVRLAELDQMLRNGSSSLHGEVISINELMKSYETHGKVLKEVAQIEETTAKQRIAWANKLQQVMRDGSANNLSVGKLDRLVQSLANPNDFKTLDELNKKLREIENQYVKIQGQQKDSNFTTNRKDKADSLLKRVNSGKLDSEIIGSQSIDDLNKEINRINKMKSTKTIDTQAKNVLNTYDQMLKKQAEIIQQRKLEAQSIEEQAKLQEHLYALEKERAQLAHDQLVKDNTIKDRVGLVGTKQSDIANRKSQMIGSGLIDAKAFTEIENKLQHIGELAKSQFVDNLDVEKELTAVDKMLGKINDQYVLMVERQREMIRSTHEWNKKIDQIKQGGFVNESEFQGVRNLMKGLNVDSEKFGGNMKAVENRIKRLDALAVKHQKEQDAVDFIKYQNSNKADDMASRGLVPDSMIQNFKALNSMLDFTSSKTEIYDIQQEMKKLVDLEEKINKAGKEESKIRQLIVQTEKELVKATDKYYDAINQIVHVSQRQVKDAEMRNKIEQQAIKIQKEINQLRERGLALSDAENRSLQLQMLALSQKAQHEKNIESDEANRAKLSQQLLDRYHSVDYRSKRGVSENSKEYNAIAKISDTVKKDVQGLGNLVGAEFDLAYTNAVSGINKLNQESQKFRDKNRAFEKSTFGQLSNAIKKVPVWVSAMGLVYGTINQIKQGFQSLLDIDKAMIDLGKVTEASTMQLDRFKETASFIGKDLGVVATQVINATAEFQKLGYTLQQSTDLGKNSILYANVGDMSIEEASANIVSTIKGFGIEVDKQGNNVRNIVDIFNEVGNNYAITSAGIGEALKRSSSVMLEAGNTIQESVGLVTGANAVIQDPAKVGNALKTVAMRLRGVSLEGDNVKQLVPQLQSTFDRINEQFGLMGKNALQLMEDDKVTFKSTYDIFKQVESVWSKLTDIERANLVETMGGKHQGVVVSAIIQNWKDAEGAMETAMHSGGSASREFSAYMDGFEYKIAQLKNALIQFWSKLVDTDMAKSFIDTLTKMTESVTMFMNVFGGGSVLAVAGGLLALFGSKSLKNAVFGLGEFAKVGGTVVGNLKSLGGTLLTLIPRFLKFTGVLALAGTAFSLIYKGIKYSSDQNKAMLKILDDEISTLEQRKKKYDEIFNGKDSIGLDDFLKLQAKGSNRSTAEDEKYLTQLQQIKQEMPDLILGYDKYNNAIFKSAQQIRALTNAEAELLKTQKNKAFELSLKESDLGDTDKQLAKLADARSKKSGSIGADTVQGNLRTYITTQMSDFQGGAGNYLQVISDFQQKVKDELAKLPAEQQKYAEMALSHFNDMAPNAQDKAGLLKNLDDMIASTKNRTQILDKEFVIAKDSFKNNSESFNKLYEEAFSNDIMNRGLDPKNAKDNNVIQFIEALKTQMKEDIDLLGTNSVEDIKTATSRIDEAFNLAKSKGVAVDELFAFDPETSKQTIVQIDKILSSLDKTKVKESGLFDIFEELKRKHESVINGINNVNIQPFNFARDAQPSIDTYMTSIQDLDSAYRTLSDGEELSLSTVMDLIKNHKELTKHMTMQNGVLTLTAEGIKEVAKIKEDEMDRSLEIDKRLAESAYNKSQSIIKNILSEAQATKYGNDVREKGLAKTAEDLKRKDVDGAMGKNGLTGLLGAWRSPFDSEKQKLLKDAEEVQRQQANSDESQKSIDAINKLIDQDFTSQLGNIGNNKDKKSKEMQDAIYVVDEYKKKMDLLNLAIEKQQAIQAKSTKWSNAYRNALTEEISLTDQKKKAIDAQIASLNNQISANKIAQTGLIQISQNKEDNKTERAKQAEIQQDIEKGIENLRQLESESAQASVKQNELNWTNLESKTSLFDIQKEMLTDDIAYQEYAMGLYDQSSEQYRKHAEEKLALIKEQMGYDEQSLALLEEEQKSNTNLTDIQIADLNNLIREKRKTVLEMANTVTDIQNIIANSRFDEMLYTMTSESEKYADKIKDIQDKIKFELDEKKDFGKHISYLKDIVALQKGQTEDAKKYIETLKKQKEEFKDNKTMVEKISDELKQWEKSLKDSQTSVKETTDEIKQVYEKFSDEYVDLYKQQVELMKQADEKFYKDKADAEQKAHDQRMKQIDIEMNALQDSYDKQMLLIDREQASKSYGDDTSKLEKETKELQKQIAILSMDDSYEARAKKSELDKQLADKMLELSQRQNDREVELRKNNIEDDFNAEKEKIDKKKSKYEEDYQNFTDNLTKQQEAQTKHWDDMLNDERKFAELRKQVMDGNFTDMETTIKKWGTDVSGHMTDLGQTITDNFTTKVNDAVAALTQLKNATATLDNKGNGFDVQVPNVTPTNVDGDKKPTADVPTDSKLNETDQIRNKVTQMKEYSRLWFEKPDNRAFYETENQKLADEIGAKKVNGEWMLNGKPLYEQFKTGGYTGDWNGDEGKLGLLHKKELILNQNQTRDILDTARIAEKLKSIIPNFMNTVNAKLSNLLQSKTPEPVATGVVEHNQYNIEVTVQGNADKGVADLVADQIVNKIKRTKGGRF